MTKVIVNLTIPIVEEEIENVLDRSSNHFYQQTFLIPELHQELIAYTLTRIRNRYIVTDETRQPAAIFASLPVSLEERLKIQDVAYQGMQHILSTAQEWMVATNGKQM